jgi:hypothetical protein
MRVFSIEGRVTGPAGDDGVAGLIIDVADRETRAPRCAW